MRAALDSARKLLVITGAGVSAESGVPTFRGAEGMWRNFRPEQLASPEGFAEDPVCCWEWYEARRQQLLTVEPNPGHFALARLEQRKDLLLITQNVDGLHRIAGSRKVVELHGNIWVDRCTEEGREFDARQLGELPLPRRCACGALLRPGVVWFGELLPEDAVLRIEQYLAPGDIDLVLIAGTSALFPYIARWGLLPERWGALVVEINPEPTPLSNEVHLSLRGPSGEILPRLCDTTTEATQ